MNIQKEKNHTYAIKPVIMANDAIIKNVVEPLPNNYGFFLMIVGKPNSGKSTLWINLINTKDKYTYYKKFDQIHIFSNSIKTITTKIKLSEDRIHDGINDINEVIAQIAETDDKTLFILDDVVCDIKDTDAIMKLIYNRRHIGGSISLIITTQVYNRIPLAIRKCASDLIVFSTGNKKEKDFIFEEFINIDRHRYDNIINYCFKDSNHDFLYIKPESGTFYHNFDKLVFD